MKRLLILPFLIATLAIASFATVSFSPSSLSFGSQAVGTTSAVQFVTFSNSGSSSQSFGTETIAGAYAWGGVGTCSSKLAAGSSCTMSLVFKPTASGTSTGSLTVGSMVISLSGTGTSSAPPAPPASSVTFSPSSLSFGSEAVGSTSAVQLVTFTNSTSSSYSFGTETIAGAYAWGGVGTCGSTVAAGSSCTMSLVFKPTASGASTGSLTVGSMVVSLSGTGGSTTPPPASVAISTTSLANGTVGSAYSATLKASGGTSPYTWSLASGSLPAGVTLSSNGTISGMPSGSCAETFSVTAKDSESTPQSASATLTLTIAAAPPAPAALKLTTTSLAGGTAGSAYSATLQATGGTSPYTWSLASGSLPAGLTLSTSGTISGTPSASGSSTFSITVKDSESTPQSVTSSFTLAIAVDPPATLQLTTTSLTGGTAGSAYSATLQATGGTSPYTWSLASGSLPAGLTLSTSGTISGTPSASGSSTFSITVKDSESTPQSVTSSFTLTIAADPPPSGSGTLASAYSSYIAANYGSAQGYTSANTYYVSATGSDSNSGSATSPWLTLSHADGATPGCALIMIGAGSWTATNQVVGLSSSGTSTCHKAFVSQTYDGATFTSTSNASNGSDIFGMNGNYVDIVGLDISGAGCAGVMASGTYNNIAYNRVHDVAPTATGQGAGYCGNGTGGGGIQFPGGSTTSGQHSNVLDNVIWNIGYSGDVWSHGIYIVSQYQTLQNNIIYNVSGGCIQAYHFPSNDVITNNVLVKCNWGYIVGAASGYSASNMTFNNNAMAGNVTFDIEECGASYCGVAMGSGNTYSNNDTSSSSSSNHLEGGTLVNNITSSPSFVDEASPASGGNFDVNSGSPLIGAGTSTDAPATDIVGASRQGTAVSIGAYQE